MTGSTVEGKKVFVGVNTAVSVDAAHPYSEHNVNRPKNTA